MHSLYDDTCFFHRCLDGKDVCDWLLTRWPAHTYKSEIYEHLTALTALTDSTTPNKKRGRPPNEVQKTDGFPYLSLGYAIGPSKLLLKYLHLVDAMDCLGLPWTAFDSL